MYPTNSLRSFVQVNGQQIENMVRYFCRTLNFQEDYSDLIQELYYKFSLEKTIQKFSKQRKTRISTYLYPIIHNFVINYVKDWRRKKLYNNTDFSYLFNFTRNNFHSHEEWRKSEDFIDYMEWAPEYINMIESNESSLMSDMKDFEDFLGKSGKNHTYKLIRRKGKQHNEGCSLLDLFRLMYEGYTVADIAKKYGITKTSVYNMKTKLISVLIEYGIYRPKNKKFFIIN